MVAGGRSTSPIVGRGCNGCQGQRRSARGTPTLKWWRADPPLVCSPRQVRPARRSLHSDAFFISGPCGVPACADRRAADPALAPNRGPKHRIPNAKTRRVRRCHPWRLLDALPNTVTGSERRSGRSPHGGVGQEERYSPGRATGPDTGNPFGPENPGDPRANQLGGPDPMLG